MAHAKTRSAHKPGEPLTVLSGRIAQVVRLLCSGVRQEEIGKQMGISTQTVKVHLQRAYNRVHISGKFCKQVRLVYLVSIGEVELL